MYGLAGKGIVVAIALLIYPFHPNRRKQRNRRAIAHNRKLAQRRRKTPVARTQAPQPQGQTLALTQARAHVTITPLD